MVSDRFVGYWIAMQKISVFLIVGNTVIDFNNFKKVWSTGFHWKRKKRQQIFLSLTITVVIYIFCMYDNVWCIYGLWNNLILFSNNPFTRIDFFLFFFLKIKLVMSLWRDDFLFLHANMSDWICCMSSAVEAVIYCRNFSFSKPAGFASQLIESSLGNSIDAGSKPSHLQPLIIKIFKMKTKKKKKIHKKYF